MKEGVEELVWHRCSAFTPSTWCAESRVSEAVVLAINGTFSMLRSGAASYESLKNVVGTDPFFAERKNRAWPL